MDWIAERNRDKLYDALQHGLIPVRCGVIRRPEALSATRWRVPSQGTPGTHYFVEDVVFWDGRRETACLCPHGEKAGPFGGTTALPCKHALAVWFFALAAPERQALIRQDLGLRYAFLQGTHKSEAEYFVSEEFE